MMKYFAAAVAVVIVAWILMLAWWMASCVPTPAPSLPAERETQSILER